MQSRKWFPTVAVLSAAAVALMVLAGAGSAARTPAPAKSVRAGVTLGSVGSGPAAILKIHRYLRSVGIDPRTVVIQTGKRNYAGKKCPGVRWNCTTATRVLQAGSDNVFQCTPTTAAVSSNSGGNQSCVITQTSNPNGSNTATCTEHTNSATATQACQITQIGRNNTATVNQQNGSNGTTESASQTSTVNQSGASGTNRATITQTVAQDASGGSTLQQNGWSRSDLVQTAVGGGKNIAAVTQRLTQNALGGTSQSQDTVAGSIGDCNPPDSPANTGPGSPNLCSYSSQSGVNGDNQMDLFQKIIEKASTGATAVQKQGFGDGGIDGKVHQDTGSLGTNYNQVNQNKIQSVVGGKGSSQTQFDPMFCCGAGSQAGGNANNHESIGQSAAQDATGAGATQEADIVGESLSPNGSCDITQSAANNADSANPATAQATPCTFLLQETSCSDGECQSSGPIFTPPTTTPLLTTLVRSNDAAPFTSSADAGQGQFVEYALTYTPPNGATEASLTDTFPFNFAYASCDSGCTRDGNTLFWSLGNVPAGQSVTVHVFGNWICGTADNAGTASAVGNDPFTSDPAHVNFVGECLG
jgi:hypothetical protein